MMVDSVCIAPPFAAPVRKKRLPSDRAKKAIVIATPDRFLHFHLLSLARKPRAPSGHTGSSRTIAVGARQHRRVFKRQKARSSCQSWPDSSCIPLTAGARRRRPHWLGAGCSFVNVPHLGTLPTSRLSSTNLLTGLLPDCRQRELTLL